MNLPPPQLTYAEIAEIMGVSPGRIQQIERAALLKLRKRLAHLAPELCEPTSESLLRQKTIVATRNKK
jgi:transcriptional regulator with XRE-family HTH domain